MFSNLKYKKRKKGKEFSNNHYVIFINNLRAKLEEGKEMYNWEQYPESREKSSNSRR